MIDRYPLQWPMGWPRTKARKSGRFHTRGNSVMEGGGYRAPKAISIADGAARVFQELQRLGVNAGDAVISSNLRLNLDGSPRSNQPEPDDPGIAVYWRTRRRGDKVMAVDLYDRTADNLAAIAATLDAMRAIERHGGAQILERAFTGFDALPAPARFDPWAELKLRPPATREQVDIMFRELAKTRHPDTGGSVEAFQQLERARREILAEIGERL